MLESLCFPKTHCFHGQSFYPVCAVPVDLFPYTNHCELIMKFERLDFSWT